MQVFLYLFSDYTLRTVAIGTAILGIVSGALGSYAVLRKTKSSWRCHLSRSPTRHMPGLLITDSKAPFVMVVGASLAGWLGILVVTAIVRNTRIKEDAALGIILAVFFGVGIVLLTLIQKMPNANQAGLDKFLFGQAAALLERDIKTMGIIGVMVIGLTLLFWKEFKLLCFDPAFGASLGFPMKILDILLMTLIVMAIVIGLQAVGVVLMSAMVVAPASAARQWTNRLAFMVCLAAFFGAMAGITGAVISSTAAKIPTGPMIVICASIIFLFSLAFAPNRGLIWRLRLKKVKFDLETTEVDSG